MLAFRGGRTSARGLPAILPVENQVAKQDKKKGLPNSRGFERKEGGAHRQRLMKSCLRSWGGIRAPEGKPKNLGEKGLAVVGVGTSSKETLLIRCRLKAEQLGKGSPPSGKYCGRKEKNESSYQPGGVREGVGERIFSETTFSGGGKFLKKRLTTLREEGVHTRKEKESNDLWKRKLLGALSL